MMPLMAVIRRRIAHTGPITVAEYMDLCLAHPQHGYYITRDPLGAAGDFTTAPEISQMFGELVGLWLAQVWLDQGAPSPFALVELGPGRGTLMADALRAARIVPGFHQATKLWLVETSPALRAKQAAALKSLGLPNWADSVNGLPDLPTFLIANEFFDAMPVRQFVRVPRGWRERMIGLAGDNLAWGLSPALQNPDLERRWPGRQPGTVVETCLSGAQIAAVLGTKITAQGGAALVVDYGEWDGTGDTLQALRQHQVTNPLREPGEADLTAHVNFSALSAASGLRAWPLQKQGAFLENLGIARRAADLQAGAKQPATITAAHRRLTHADEMGNLFKALCLTRADAPAPLGFAE